jgi:chromosome segregation ATPase
MITYVQVAAAADALAAKGIEPQAIDIREQLGNTGSLGTIQKHVTTWRVSKPKVVAVPTVCPKSIIDAVNNEFAIATADVRAEIGSQLVIAQEESSNLAAITEALEAELEECAEKISILTQQNDSLHVTEEKLQADIRLLNDDKTRDRIIIEQGRTEIAQLRNKLELLEVTVSQQLISIETLQTENVSETKKRIDAEKDAAVLTARLEAERDKAATLLTDKAILTDQLNRERQAAEAARNEASKIAAELATQVAKLAENNLALKELSIAHETEKNARIAAHKNAVELREQLAEAHEVAEAVRIEAAQCADECQAHISALAEKDTTIEELTSNLEHEKNAKLNAQKQVSAFDKKLDSKTITDVCGQ